WRWGGWGGRGGVALKEGAETRRSRGKEPQGSYPGSFTPAAKARPCGPRPGPRARACATAAVAELDVVPVEAVVLDLMQPIAAGRQFVDFGREARRDEPGRKGTLQHADLKRVEQR